jgi:hypothetical protein
MASPPIDPGGDPRPPVRPWTAKPGHPNKNQPHENDRRCRPGPHCAKSIERRKTYEAIEKTAAEFEVPAAKLMAR